MRTLTTLLVLASLSACGKEAAKEPPPKPAPAEPTPPPPPPKVEPKVEAPPADDGSAAVADLVVKSVGSKALGSQTIEPSCVTVTIVPAGTWTIAAGRLEDCGDKTARSLVWLYKRQGNGLWNEDYAGQPPKCWKGVPADIAPAVKIATGIPTC